MKHSFLKKLCFLLLAGTSFVAFADDEVAVAPDQVVASEAESTSVPGFSDVATTPTDQATQTDQPAVALPALPAQTDAEVAQAALMELQSLYDLLSTKKHKEGVPLKTGKRVIRGAGAATITALVAGLMKLIKQDLYEGVDTLGWLGRGLFFGGICVGTYEALGTALPENAALYRLILSNVLSHWNLYQMLIPEEYVPVIQVVYEAFVANNHQVPLSEAEAKKFVRTIKYDVKHKMRTHAS